MAIMFPDPISYYPPIKRRRRTATSVCAGDHDPRPRRDVLTSVLNGVPPNPEAENRGIEHRRRVAANPTVQAPVEKSAESKKKRGRPPKVRTAPLVADTPADASISAPTPATPIAPVLALPAFDASIYGTRPHVHLPQVDRSLSVTPPPMPSSPPTTPGPSISSSTSRTSSKRPHTPDDFFLGSGFRDMSSSTPPPNIEKPPKPRKKRVQTRKGWKGWVEISEDEEEASTKLISSEAPLILSVERRTRSGRVV